jgi:hypothetical protein
MLNDVILFNSAVSNLEGIYSVEWLENSDK